MNITVISASNRPNSQSLKISHRIIEKLKAKEQNTKLIDLNMLRLPLFVPDETPENWNEEIEPVISESDGYVFVVPEWNGMAPPAMLNFLSFVGSTTMAHKPVLLTSVSGGLNGSYPLAELKAFGSKNRHYNLMPDHLIVKNAKALLNSETPDTENQTDVNLHERMDYELGVLTAYSEKLSELRKDERINSAKYPHGV